MHVLDRAHREAPAHRGKIDRLAAGHPTGADRVRQHTDHLEPQRGAVAIGRVVRQHGESERLQCIAGQDRGRFVEGAMAGRPSAPQIIIVHGRQVVVDQAVDVDQLDSGGGGIELLERRAESFAGEVHEYRPQALAAAEHAVAHGLVQPRGGRIGQRQRTLEHPLDARLTCGDARGETRRAK